jgi:hypothetical protein
MIKMCAVRCGGGVLGSSELCLIVSCGLRHGFESDAVVCGEDFTW